MIETMRMSAFVTTTAALLAWLWGWFWYFANAAAAVAIATAVQLAFAPSSTTLTDAAPLAPVAFWSLIVFFWFVWPPIPKIELAIRELLRRRREQRASRAFEDAKPGARRIGGEAARQLRLHVPQRDITDRSRGEE